MNTRYSSPTDVTALVSQKVLTFLQIIVTHDETESCLFNLNILRNARCTPHNFLFL